MRRASSVLALARRHVLALAATLVLVVGLVAGYAWLRDSPMVAVQEVAVTGATGPRADEVRAAISDAARDMTTLHVRRDRLLAAVAGHPQVKSLEADADFPHTLRVHVRERPPVAALTAGGRRVPVAADGTLLETAPDAEMLPTLQIPAIPGGGRLTGGGARGGLTLVAAAPLPMRKLVARIVRGPEGLEAILRDGPTVVLGTAERPRAKWIAAARVLADAAADSPEYIDVRLPDRPTAGGFSSSGG